MIEKVRDPKIKLKTLPGLEVEPKEEETPGNGIGKIDLDDSDDAAEVALVEKVYPRERPREGCCTKMKQIDMYGIEPGMVIKGRPKFKSCWGAFFSILTVVAVLYYLGMKMIFLYTN